eukprot:CAMPEP_0198133216 /NCGR_PEP_ID=MMETSP1442-20131203/59451_1 /TAXON_ID= /ORGANISM="Craspedostauros australis, Strain CCMP3328" /LENGTH=137 /DNA_ID=CAMNT_0043794327 /DNA_START=113 /DNA_END=526 /DNA_ORIENTATION=+
MSVVAQLLRTTRCPEGCMYARMDVCVDWKHRTPFRCAPLAGVGDERRLREACGIWHLGQAAWLLLRGTIPAIPSSLVSSIGVVESSTWPSCSVLGWLMQGRRVRVWFFLVPGRAQHARHVLRFYYGAYSLLPSDSSG